MTNDRFSRQSFLGEGAQEIIGNSIIGICGHGGGGSQSCSNSRTSASSIIEFTMATLPKTQT